MQLPLLLPGFWLVDVRNKACHPPSEKQPEKACPRSASVPNPSRTRKVPSPLIIITFAVTLAPPTCDARIWRVEADGGGDYQSIQEGIVASQSGDTILVGIGLYSEHIDFIGKDLVVRSILGPGLTTIDGSQFQGSVVTFSSQETRSAVLEGFTITGGTGSTDFGVTPRGGGIICVESSPTIRGNRIIGNSLSIAHSIGAGIAVGSGLIDVPVAEPLIEKNLFENNVTAGNGGGVSIQHSCAVICNNSFKHNSCEEDGGGIWGIFLEAGSTIENNWFSDNLATDHGGGMYLSRLGSGKIISVQRNVLVRNVASGISPADSSSGGGMWLYGLSGQIVHNTLVGNEGRDPSICGGGGGMFIEDVDTGLELALNIVALSIGCGITSESATPRTGVNLFWGNQPFDSLENWDAQIVADPLFCSVATDDYSLSYGSPGFVGGSFLGAIPESGCALVRVSAASWGHIKAMFLKTKPRGIR